MAKIPDTIINEIRANADNGNGNLTQGTLDYIYEAKLFKLFVPMELNGLMLSLPEALKVFEKAAWIDGSFGWLVTIGSGGGFFSATLAPEQARQFFSHSKAVVAGSGHPNGVAKRVDGGYNVSGEWKYCSGSTYASVFTANCRIQNEDGEEEQVRSFAFLPEQVSIIKDWNAFGLKATESHTIAVEQAFVPTERTFDTSSAPNYEYPIFRYPFLPFAQTSFAAVCLGICRHFLEESRSFAEAREVSWSQSYPLRLQGLLHKLEEQEARLEAVSEQFYNSVVHSWEDFITDFTLPEAKQDEVSQICKEVARASLECAHTIFPLLGMTALMEDNLLNRIWRDLHTVTQHSVLVSV
ncbi:acyl-CoA dehydrogenase family protein [Cohnella abietis]|uniref:Hydroxylase n=1 Tax=Cohnella abietis TaxID=2507935 RepID=A0A3T1D088_9BACL|nr:acyl-CoA dehydrogenase [Cohnella abietis]BBI31425.1 hydroxylase [Cohnella abietis]